MAGVCVGALTPGVVGSPEIGWQIAPSVGSKQFEGGVAIENARENEVTQGDRVLQWLADDVGQIPAIEPALDRAAQGMQEHQSVSSLARDHNASNPG